jgi:hypothetical protein
MKIITPNKTRIKMWMMRTNLLPKDMEQFMSYEVNETDYLNAMNTFEKELEDNLKDILGRMGIHTTTKTDRKSLPYNKEITTIKRMTSIVNDAYTTEEFIFEVVKQIINSQNKKVRFYVECTHKETEGNYFNQFFEFSFKYHEPNNAAEKN